jgi:hypothetical protein
LFALHTMQVERVEQCNVAGTTNEKCRFCPAGEWCDAGRIDEALENFMVYEPYSVEIGARA